MFYGLYNDVAQTAAKRNSWSPRETSCKQDLDKILGIDMLTDLENVSTT